MATSQISGVIQHPRTAVLLRDGAGRSDGQLLTDYINRRDEAALPALVHRHAPMVWGVCRRVVRNHHDAEDAFQATFLVLVREAASIASRELLANWLYGVAHQTALKARATAARRKERERQVTEMPEPAVAEQDLWHDLQPLLDEELGRLPDKFRAVIVLCDLEGRTRKEVARQLAVPEGTVGGWLARARRTLAKRLAQRGVALPGGALAAVLSAQVASAGVPTSPVASTIKAASLFAAGQGAATGVISAQVGALTEGVLKTMLLSKLKTVMASVLLVAALLGGAGLISATQGGEGADGPAAAPGDKRPGADKPPPGEDRARREEKPKTDMQRIQGTWKLVETYKHGKRVGAKDIPIKPHELVFDGSGVATKLIPDGGGDRGEFALNAAATPKQITITWLIQWRAIYRLGAGRLVLCFNPDNGIRPDAFRTTADSERVLFVYERVKEKPRKQPVPPVPGKGEARSGTRWEYKQLSHDEIKALEFKRRGAGTADGGLNLLGEEGWELVAIEPPVAGPTPPVGGRPALYVFKRQKK